MCFSYIDVVTYNAFLLYKFFQILLGLFVRLASLVFLTHALSLVRLTDVPGLEDALKLL